MRGRSQAVGQMFGLQQHPRAPAHRAHFQQCPAPSVTAWEVAMLKRTLNLHLRDDGMHGGALMLGNFSTFLVDA